MDNGPRRERSRARKARRRRHWLWFGAGTAMIVVMLLAAFFAFHGGLGESSSSSQPPPTTATGMISTSSTTAPATATTAATTTTTAAQSTTSTQALDSSTSTIALSAAPLVKTGPTSRKWIALTFDDNYQLPTAYNTLAVLVKYKVPATLFVIGHYVDTGPDLALQIAADGFEVGDHTRSHADCTSLSKRGLRIEIGNGTDHYRQLTGASTVALFRPPGGYVDQKTCEVAAEKGFRYVVMWDIDTNDWRGRTAAQITETVTSNAHSGAIVLMHMAAEHTAEALPTIITRLRAAGYELVTLSAMLGL